MFQISGTYIQNLKWPCPCDQVGEILFNRTRCSGKGWWGVYCWLTDNTATTEKQRVLQMTLLWLVEYHLIMKEVAAGCRWLGWRPLITLTGWAGHAYYIYCGAALMRCLYCSAVRWLSGADKGEASHRVLTFPPPPTTDDHTGPQSTHWWTSVQASLHKYYWPLYYHSTFIVCVILSASRSCFHKQHWPIRPACKRVWDGWPPLLRNSAPGLAGPLCNLTTYSLFI